MCIACKVYGKQKIVSEPVLKRALASLKELYYDADEEMLAHLDALTNRWLLGKEGEKFARDIETDALWERNHRQ
jgi:shikimate kinase